MSKQAVGPMAGPFGEDRATNRRNIVTKRYHLLIAALLALLAIALAGASLFRIEATGVAEPRHGEALPSPLGQLEEEPLLPLPAVPDLPPERVALGEALFFDPILSGDNTVSCASCHKLAAGGADDRSFSLGVGGARGIINAPTVFNAALNFAQFWDGRADSLESQIDGPVTNPIEMNADWPGVLQRLQAQADYARRFGEAYPDGVTADNVRDALASFERTLLTPDAPLDRYLLGDRDALNADQKEGYRRFKQLGCASCHQGANVGGNLFQRFGVMVDYFAERGTASEQTNLGRFNVTGDADDLHVFKVPSLRNVAQTAPYFHDGSVDSLEEAVTIMGRVQLGQRLSDEDVRYIVAFLGTLSGHYRRGRLQ